MGSPSADAQQGRPKPKPQVAPTTAAPADTAPRPAASAAEPLRAPERVEVTENFPPIDPTKGYTLGIGDVVRVSVYQQPDMQVETRVSEVGTITVPLLGAVEVMNLSTKQAETRIGNLLRAKGLMREPHVNLTILQFKSRQVSVLGYVNRPGRYVMEEGSYRITDVLALAGGVIAGASDIVTLVRGPEGDQRKFDIDVPGLFRTGKFELNMEIRPGDTLYVDKAPQFYIYGEVQRPGAYRVEKDLTLMQALSIGGGLTLRASRKDIQITRRDQQGKLTAFPASLSERILPDDTIYVKESLF